MADAMTRRLRWFPWSLSQWATMGLGLITCLFASSSLTAGEADLSPVIRFELDTGTFDVPYGYLQGRPPLSVFEKQNRKYCGYPGYDCFYLVFSMPDGGFSQESATDSLIISPIVDGKIDLSVQPKFYVIAGAIMPVSYETSPERRLRNLGVTDVDLNANPTSDGAPQQVFTKLYRKTSYSTYYASFLTNDTYRHHVSYFIRCNGTGTVPNPLCDGTAVLQGVSVSFHFRFQARYLKETPLIFTKANELLMSWKK